MAHVARLRVYPVKGLDPVEPDAVAIRPGGTLAGDREFALLADGETVNAKQSGRLARIETDYDPATARLTVAHDERRTFDLDEAAGRERAGAWFDDRLDADVTLARGDAGGFVDRPGAGPSVISTATLRTVAGWFDEMTVAGARRRLRANVEVSGVEPFWEDRFVGPDAPAVAVDGVRLEGVEPCARCIVPARDPETGDPDPEFRERFVERRRATFPEFADESAFDHYYTLMLIAAIPDGGGERLSVGAPVTLLDDA